ncbi:MAG: DUF4388 domain-containing protein [Acidobacteria bacterium]|nr:DUF4388 domain-containing protein [Acidobacteriota bacterium]
MQLSGARNGTGGAGMPLTLSDLPLTALLFYLAERSASGTLSVVAPRHRKKLYLVEGLLAGITSDNPRDLLGHFLIGWGMINEEQLSEAMRIQDRHGSTVGQILEQMGAVDPSELAKALQAQAEEAVLDLFQQPLKDVWFLEDSLPADRPLSLRLALPALVLEGVRRRQRYDEIWRALGGLDVIPEAVPTPAMPPMSSRERHILFEIDGTRDAEEVALVCHVSPFQVHDLIERGVREGFITVTRKVGTASSHSTATLVQEADAALARGDLRRVWDLLETLRATDNDKPTLLEVGRIERFVEETLAQHRISGVLIPRLAKPEGLAAVPVLRPSEAFVLSRINDLWSLREIGRIAPVGDLEFGIIVVTLQQRGLIELRHPKGGPAVP